MERLLNVRDAAKFLKVSEMTVRRWTNAGLLHCYRIGPKRERRFRPRELEEFLTGTAAAGRRVGPTPAVASMEIPDGAHVTHLYRDAGEAMAVGVRYVLEGLHGEDTVLVVRPEAGRRAFLETLRRHGLDVDAFRHRGRLQLSAGMPTPAEQAKYIAEAASTSNGRFRLLGEMRWARERGWTIDQIRSLEEMSNKVMPYLGKRFLCQYGLELFSGQETMMALETHEYTIYRGRIQGSPFFGPN